MSRSIRLTAAGAAAAVLVALFGPSGVGAQDPVAPANSTTPVPILLYHHIAKAPKRSSSPTLYVPSALFKQQMAALARAGYEAVTMDTVWSAWTEGGELPDKPIVVSFDDGFTDQYTGALPVMKARGWPGVLNLIVKSPYAPKITTTQVNGMLKAGWELDAHTATHPDLSKITDPARLTREIVDARTALQTKYKVPVNFIAYPFGHVNQRVAQVVINDAGFTGGLTTVAGLATPGTDPARLPRVIVSPKTSGPALVAKLAKLNR
ncbi:hypothetical protein DSM112329_03353 [Paraconexibacter sp. AEG42_29]|uniref:NodB homology domain-containing protein n=1 Tax=Paraconexibacter sp. AEG42_29 TaxID=2997339 RepID=A0AAU7AYT4_9ACTN